MYRNENEGALAGRTRVSGKDSWLSEVGLDFRSLVKCSVLLCRCPNLDAPFFFVVSCRIQGNLLQCSKMNKHIHSYGRRACQSKPSQAQLWHVQRYHTALFAARLPELYQCCHTLHESESCPIFLLDQRMFIPRANFSPAQIRKVTMDEDTSSMHDVLPFHL